MLPQTITVKMATPRASTARIRYYNQDVKPSRAVSNFFKMGHPLSPASSRYMGGSIQAEEALASMRRSPAVEPVSRQVGLSRYLLYFAWLLKPKPSKAEFAVFVPPYGTAFLPTPEQELRFRSLLVTSCHLTASRFYGNSSLKRIALLPCGCLFVWVIPGEAMIGRIVERSRSPACAAMLMALRALSRRRAFSGAAVSCWGPGGIAKANQESFHHRPRPLHCSSCSSPNPGHQYLLSVLTVYGVESREEPGRAGCSLRFRRDRSLMADSYYGGNHETS